MGVTAATPTPRGLTEAEARRALAARPARRRKTSSRSYASIVRANVFTIFNLILLVFGVTTLVFGEWQDALFLGVLVANSGIGIYQEVRAKRALDRLAALVAPQARVDRGGVARLVPADEVCRGDLVRIQAGDQVVADGTISRSDGLALDESILTGESGAVERGPGEEARSGSFAVEGAAKSAFAVFLIVSVGLTPIAYPLLPRHLTLAASLTIGIPAFFLALAPSAGSMEPERFLREVARFAVPAGVGTGLGVLSAYLFALNVVNRSLVESRTVATTVLVAVGLYLILALEASGRRRGVAVTALCGALAAAYVAVLSVPFARGFFELAAPSAQVFGIAVGGMALALAGLWLTDERFVPDYGRRQRRQSSPGSRSAGGGSGGRGEVGGPS